MEIKQNSFIWTQNLRFMFDNVIESLTHAKTNPGFGCVLARAMGLGKTLQVVSFTDVFLRSTGHLHTLIIVPVNTIQTWKGEFKNLLPERLAPTGFAPNSPEKRPIRKFRISHHISTRRYEAKSGISFRYVKYRETGRNMWSRIFAGKVSIFDAERKMLFKNKYAFVKIFLIWINTIYYSL